MFGGILTLTEARRRSDGTTGYQYMADMWKFNMLSNQWDVMESYGVSRILREVYLWNLTKIVQPITTKQKLGEDMKYTEFDPVIKDVPLEE
jgi:hypothetical protein